MQNNESDFMTKKLKAVIRETYSEVRNLERKNRLLIIELREKKEFIRMMEAVLMQRKATLSVE